MEAKTALVTGASRGIGLAIAKLSARGLLSAATSAAGAEQISQHLGERGRGLKLPELRSAVC